jgi:hypothetical protein
VAPVASTWRGEDPASAPASPAVGADDPTGPDVADPPVPVEGVADEDVSAGLRIPEGIDMSTSAVDPDSVDLEWIDRYTTGEQPAQPADDDDHEA